MRAVRFATSGIRSSTSNAFRSITSFRADSPKELVIVGGGASLPYTLDALDKQYNSQGNEKKLSVKVIEENAALLGKGVAFSTNDPDHQLNILYEKVPEFAKWWEQRPESENYRETGGYLPRGVVGSFLEEKLNHIFDKNKGGKGNLDITVIEDEVLSVRHKELQDSIKISSVVTANNGEITGEHFVCATGHEGSKELNPIPRDCVYVDSIYAKGKGVSPLVGALGGLDKSSPRSVMIVGFGPTGIDAMKSLQSYNKWLRKEGLKPLKITIVAHDFGQMNLPGGEQLTTKEFYKREAKDRYLARRERNGELLPADIVINAIGISYDPPAFLYPILGAGASRVVESVGHRNKKYMEAKNGVLYASPDSVHMLPLINMTAIGSFTGITPDDDKKGGLGYDSPLGDIAKQAEAFANGPVFFDGQRQLDPKLTKRSWLEKVTKLGELPYAGISEFKRADDGIFLREGDKRNIKYKQSRVPGKDRNEQLYNLTYISTSWALLRTAMVTPKQVATPLCVLNGDVTMMVPEIGAGKQKESLKDICENQGGEYNPDDPKKSIFTIDENGISYFSYNLKGKMIQIPTNLRVASRQAWGMVAGKGTLMGDKLDVWMVQMTNGSFSKRMPESLQRDPDEFVSVPSFAPKDGDLKGFLPDQRISEEEKDRQAHERIVSSTCPTLSLKDGVRQNVTERQSERRNANRAYNLDRMTSEGNLTQYATILHNFIATSPSAYKDLSIAQTESFFDRVDVKIRAGALVKMRADIIKELRFGAQSRGGAKVKDAFAVIAKSFPEGEAKDFIESLSGNIPIPKAENFFLDKGVNDFSAQLLQMAKVIYADIGTEEAIVLASRFSREPNDVVNCLAKKVMGHLSEYCIRQDNLQKCREMTLTQKKVNFEEKNAFMLH